jgi:phage head maturation protease
MSQWQAVRTEAIATVRESTDEPRTIEGLAVPYNQVARDTELGAEAFAPGAFKASVDHWMTRGDGARMAFRAAHGEKPIGVVTFLDDTPAGVPFKASIMEGAAGDEYLAGVRAGLNGVSIEAGLPKGSKRGRDGTVIHREARLFAIAGSVSPAYDGARIALRDTEDATVDENTTPATTEAEDAARDMAAERRELEVADVAATLPRRDSVVITRPESIYGPGRDHGFMRDAFEAWRGDSEARERQSRHSLMLTDVSRQIERASDVLSSEIPGMYPNEYLPGLLTPRILKGRPFGSFYQRVPISDAKPKIFAKVTTSGTVAVQSAEGAALTATDIATTAVTATPLIYGTYTDVSRQAIDGADPSAQSMILQDLIEAYAQASETVIKTAVEAGSTASGVAITAATPYAGVLANVINYYGVRFKPAEGAFIPSALYSVLLAQGDTTGRPFLPMIGQANSDGSVARGGIRADALGADTRLSYASTTNVCVFGVPSDFVIYESSVAQFTFAEVVGPQAVRIGIWAYLVVGTRLGSLKVTAA